METIKFKEEEVEMGITLATKGEVGIQKNGG